MNLSHSDLLSLCLSDVTWTVLLCCSCFYLYFFTAICTYGTVCFTFELSFNSYSIQWQLKEEQDNGSYDEKGWFKDYSYPLWRNKNYHFPSCCSDVHMFIFIVRYLAQESCYCMFCILLCLLKTHWNMLCCLKTKEDKNKLLSTFKNFALLCEQ